MKQNNDPAHKNACFLVTIPREITANLLINIMMQNDERMT